MEKTWKRRRKKGGGAVQCGLYGGGVRGSTPSNLRGKVNPWKAQKRGPTFLKVTKIPLSLLKPILTPRKNCVDYTG